MGEGRCATFIYKYIGSWRFSRRRNGCSFIHLVSADEVQHVTLKWGSCRATPSCCLPTETDTQILCLHRQTDSLSTVMTDRHPVYSDRQADFLSTAIDRQTYSPSTAIGRQYILSVYNSEVGYKLLSSISLFSLCPFIYLSFSLSLSGTEIAATATAATTAVANTIEMNAISRS